MSELIETRGSRNKSNLSDFKVVTYESYKAKGKKAISLSDSNEGEDLDNATNAFNMKKTRFEIIKLGMSSLDAKRKVEAKIDLAIKLGAKPPKRKYQNYKDLLKERKESKRKEAKLVKMEQLDRKRHDVSAGISKMYKNKRKNPNILGIYGTVKPTDVKKHLAAEKMKKK